MAAALSFRTLFSLLPVLVVATLVVKGLIGLEPFLAMAEELLVSVGLDTIRVIPSDGVSEQSQTISVWLKEMFGQAAKVNLAAVHWIGVALMLYAALSLMVTIENCLNVIVRGLVVLELVLCLVVDVVGLHAGPQQPTEIPACGGRCRSRGGAVGVGPERSGCVPELWFHGWAALRIAGPGASVHDLGLPDVADGSVWAGGVCHPSGVARSTT